MLCSYTKGIYSSQFLWDCYSAPSSNICNESNPSLLLLSLTCSALHCPARHSTITSSPENAAFRLQLTSTHKRAQDHTSKMLWWLVWWVNITWKKRSLTLQDHLSDSLEWGLLLPCIFCLETITVLTSFLYWSQSYHSWVAKSWAITAGHFKWRPK